METVRQTKGLLLPKFIARLERERNENRSDNIQRDNHHEAAIIRSGVVVNQAIHREGNSGCDENARGTEPALRQLGFLLKEG